jgi:hexosaminidase
MKRHLVSSVLAVVTGLYGTTALTAAGPAIVPKPAKMEVLEGTFSLDGEAPIVAHGKDKDVQKVAACLAGVVERAVGRRPQVVASAPNGEPALSLRLVPGSQALRDEGYAMLVGPKGVEIRAATARGLFWGVQTLRQLLPPDRLATRPADPGPVSIPCLKVQDRPRYPWRGMHLDVCRHFLPAEYVKRYIDLMALHKMNVFHWHLTEDQGWRIEMKKYPKLTEVAAWRMQDGRRYGGFYTQDEIRDVVAYAADRFITVVPEIEMPGHSLAALAAYPEYSCTGGPHTVANRWGIFEDVYCPGNDATLKFLQDILSETMALFPSEFIHVGGDECPKARWKECPKCQARIKAEGLTDEHELQSWFITQMSRFLEAKGRRLVGWDEILEGGLAPGATVMSWRGTKGGIAAARANHDAVMTPSSHCYLNFWNTEKKDDPGHVTGAVTTLEKVYGYEPTPTELSPEEAKHILGVQANVWTEYIQDGATVERMAYPRACALAEVAWTPAEEKSWDDFSRRMETHRHRLDALDVNYYGRGK